MIYNNFFIFGYKSQGSYHTKFTNILRIMLLSLKNLHVMLFFAF